MEIITRKVQELTPYAQNTKKHDQKQIDNVANSIKRFGWQQPIVIDEQGVVVIGHCRLLAAKKLGLKEVPVTVASGLTDEEIRELRIADNKTNESPWDLEMLEVELPSLSLEGFDFDFGIKKSSDWFESRERYEKNDGTDEEYNQFLEKFEPKKTTDDCYTPDNIYDAVSQWVSQEYAVEKERFVRPFYPGGNYETYAYPDNCVVVDNPPFSILAEIIRFYCSRRICFFLFAPALTLFSASDQDVSYITTGVSVTYENGANVSTSFVTNMDKYRIRTACDLYSSVHAANKENLKAMHKELPKFSYPDSVVTAALLQRWCKYGVDFFVRFDECLRISALDAQKEEGATIFGGGFLLSEGKTKDRSAAEKAAAEKAARKCWRLSEREQQLVRSLGTQEEVMPDG